MREACPEFRYVQAKIMLSIETRALVCYSDIYNLRIFEYGKGYYHYQVGHEAIRYAQKGAVDPSQARESVDALTERKYPVIEEVDGRIYLHAKRKSAVDVALVILAQRHPRRVAAEDLVTAIRGNGFSRNNAKTAVGRIKKYVDIDGEGRLRLLTTGLQRAEEVIGRALEALAAKR